MIRLEYCHFSGRGRCCASGEMVGGSTGLDIAPADNVEGHEIVDSLIGDLNGEK